MSTIRGGWTKGARSLALALPFALVCGIATAQVSATGEKSEGENVGDNLPTVLERVQVTQHLNAQLPLAASFTDDHGNPVTLGSYFDGKHPVIFSTVYYNCPMLCSEELDGLVSALMMVNLKPGKDFQIVMVSIDPSETPQLAAQTKARFVKRYGQPETANGFHFLVGQKPGIDQVTDTVGFGYVKVPGPDGRLTQYAHASAIEIATPTGRLAQYYLGVEYSPKDILLGLVDASGNKIGSPVANILTYCYHYDPQTNKHSLIVARVVQLAGIATVLSLGSFMIVMFRRDLKNGAEPAVNNDRRNG
ncbi:protein SCO1/2 [Bryocella elongata]|uniref:Protein SCO1/2 n=1 Tax=Bryocella elongata TaxID=863522 RepID=A0A1H5YI20_9BACT|nr:SCO family protein [Bryocella elongata]SEG23763.1 protein SCO1/2 [Bryocella elongata]